MPSLLGAYSGSVVQLEASEAHHLVHVRRALAGVQIEVFDEAGLRALATLRVESERAAVVLLSDPTLAQRPSRLVIYSAIPKGSRADWMLEKLAELGVSALVPLRTQRSVVDPGAGKLDRLRRIAREAAKQSRSAGTMEVAQPLSLEQALQETTSSGQRGCVLTTEQPGAPLAQVRPDVIFVGPEGGWADAELGQMLAAGLVPARLTATTLRVETAAICAAAILLTASPEQETSAT